MALPGIRRLSLSFRAPGSAGFGLGDVWITWPPDLGRILRGERERPPRGALTIAPAQGHERHADPRRACFARKRGSDWTGERARRVAALGKLSH
jgi:hypothetical protein